MIGYPRPSDRHLEFFGDAEGDLFAGLDLDRFTRCRITAHAGSTVPHLQTPESGDLHPLAFLQVFSDQAGKILKNFLALLFGELMLFRQGMGQLLCADRLSGRRPGCRGLRCGCRCCGCYVSHGRLLLVRDFVGVT